MNIARPRSPKTTCPRIGSPPRSAWRQRIRSGSMPDQRHACTPRQGTAGAWLHRLALLTASVTLVLIFVGGLVTNTGSALAGPGWPTTFGYSMFLYPWSGVGGGIFYEPSHPL